MDKHQQTLQRLWMFISSKMTDLDSSNLIRRACLFISLTFLMIVFVANMLTLKVPLTPN